MTCDFQQCDILTSVDSDEPVQSPFKLWNSKWCSVSRLTVIEYYSDMQRVWLECAYVQAGLSLCWSHIPHCWKSHVTAHMGLGTIKPVFRVSDTVRLKPVSLATETSWKIEISHVASLEIIFFNKWITKTLIRLWECAGWSAPVLFVNHRTQVFCRVEAHLSWMKKAHFKGYRS